MAFETADPITRMRRLPARLGALSIVLIAGALAVLGLALSSPAAAASPSITVSPSTGLHDGQTVTVHGTGYSANVKNINVIQCPVSGAGQNTCNIPDAKLFQSTDGSGSFTVQLVVRAKLGNVDCAKQACMIDAHEGTSETSGNDASVTLHFGSAPTSGTSSTPGGGPATTGSSGNGSSGSGSTPGAGSPTGANTGHEDVGTPRIAATLALAGLGAVLLSTGLVVHLRRRNAAG